MKSPRLVILGVCGAILIVLTAAIAYAFHTTKYSTLLFKNDSTDTIAHASIKLGRQVCEVQNLLPGGFIQCPFALRSIAAYDVDLTIESGIAITAVDLLYVLGECSYNDTVTLNKNYELDLKQNAR